MQPAFLYVEDEPLSRQVMTMLLRRMGYTQLTIFEDSDSFLNRIEQLNPVPDLIFLDVHVEPQDGFEMLRALRAHPVYRSKTVVALTASVMNEEVALLEEAGFDGALAKPLDFDEFPALLGRVLAGEKVWFIT